MSSTAAPLHAALMDSQGNVHMTKTLRDQVEEGLREMITEVPDGEEMPKDAAPIDSKSAAVQLAGLNRRARLAFYSERRRGASEQEAIDAAMATYRR